MASSSMKGVVVPVTLVGLVSAGIVGYNVAQRPGWTQTCVDKSTNVRVDDSQCDTSNYHSGGHVYGWYYTHGGRYVSVGSRVPAGGTTERPRSNSIAKPTSSKSGTVRRGGFGSSGMNSGSDDDSTTTRSKSKSSSNDSGSKARSGSSSSKSKSKSKSGSSSSGSKVKSKSGGS